VTERNERGHYVCLGLPIGRFHFRRKILVERGRARAIKKNQDFEFLFHAVISSV
jgi:hypothetical protein